MIPTAPTGDMVWAASPMSSRPGRCQRRRRHASTARSEVWLQWRSASVRPASHGTRSATERRSASSPSARRRA